jgi:ubiquinone/menaquinone biosynthesis C-methylase UbiE
VDIRQLEDIKLKFTELGVALADLSDRNEQTFEDLEKSLTSVEKKVSSLLKPEELQSLRGAVKSISEFTQGIAPIFERISTDLGSPMISLERSIGGASESFDRINRELSVFSLPTREGRKKEDKKDESKEGKKKDKQLGLLAEEGQRLKSMIQQGAGTLKIPLPGAMAGGLITLAIWGLKEKDRIRQEVGESLNIVTYAFDSGVKGLVNKAASYIGNLGDQMNKFYGISRDNVQAVAREYVEGGVKIEEMLHGVDRSFGAVGKNYLTFALGLDKMFELSSGESARRTVELMSDYGKDLEGARKSWLSMLMAGKDSGIGTAQFVKNVTGAADSLKQLGYDIDNVVNLAVGLQAAYQDMGVPRQMAGQQAALGLQQLAQGMSSISDAWKRVVGEEMGLGTGIEAKQKFEDVINRVTTRSEGEEADLELQNAILAMIRVASRGGQEGETVTREILSSDMGLGFKGAQAAMTIKEAVDSGDLKRASKLTQENKRILVESLRTEGQKQSKWQRYMNQWLQGLSKIGQGIVGMLGHGLANLIAYFKALVPLIGNYITGDKEANKHILDEIQNFTKSSSGYIKYFKSGFKDLKKASMSAGMEVFGQSLDAIQGAISFDPFSEVRKEVPGLAGVAPTQPQGGRADVAGIEGAIPLDLGATPQPIPLSLGDLPKAQILKPRPVKPMVRTLIVSTKEPGVYPLSPAMRDNEPQFVEGSFEETPIDYNAQPKVMESSMGSGLLSQTEAAPDDLSMDWVGGGISLVNRSVGGLTASGDIIIEAIGNCPRCGLIFGEDFGQVSNYAPIEMPSFDEEDEMALARMLRSEVGAHRELEGTTKTEAVGIAYTAINRLRSGKYEGSTLREMITGGEGFGRQGLTKTGKMRPYSTKKEATPESLELAREIMSGRYADPTGGATNFYHSTRGQGYGSRIHPELRTEMPRFTQGKINTLNINNASFWANKRLAKQKAADANEWQAREEAKFARVHKKTEPSVPQEMEDWELETGVTPAG